MRSNDFEKRLKHTLHQTTINQEHLEHTIILSRKEMSQRYPCERISFLQLVSKQIRFIGWKAWGAQGLLLLFISSMMEFLYGQFFWESPQSMVRLLICLSVLVAMSALPFMYRVVRYRMHEIEAAAYFSSAKLLMAKLAVIGIGDILLLIGIFCVSIFKTPMQVGNASFYLCLPFLTVSSASLFMMGHFPAKLFFAGNMGLCSILICAAISVPGQFYWLFGQSFSIEWLTVCGILIAFCAVQCHHLLYRCPYAEMQVNY